MKTNIFALFLCALGLSSSLAMAQTTPISVECISADGVATIARDFPQFSAYANGAQFCDDGSKDFAFISTLNKIRTIEFENVMPVSADELFQNRFSFKNGWYAYFTQRINTLKDATNLPGCAKSDWTIAYVYRNSDQIMYACPRFFDKKLITIEKASVLLHEARHKDGFPHITCTQGSRKGQPGACDTRISDKGSYAVSVESLSQISKYAKGLNPALRLYSATSALSYAEAFEEPVKINKNAYLFLKVSDASFVKINSDLTVEKTNVSSLAGRLIDKNGMTVVLPDDRTQKAKIFTNLKLELLETQSITVELFNGSDLAEKEKWVDINYGHAVSIIKKNEIEFICDLNSLDKRTQLAIPSNLSPLSMIYPYDKTDITKTSDYLLTTSGQVLELSCDKQFQPHIEFSKMNLNGAYTRMVNVKGVIFALGTDGKLYSIQNNQSQLVESTKAMTFTELVPRESILFFE